MDEFSDIGFAFCSITAIAIFAAGMIAFAMFGILSLVTTLICLGAAVLFFVIAFALGEGWR